MKKCKLFALGLLTLVMMAALAVIPVINPAQSANADALTLLGTTDTNDESHWENLFTKDDGRYFNHQVGEIFAHALAL